MVEAHRAERLMGEIEEAIRVLDRPLRSALRRRIQSTRATVRVSFSSSDGRTLAEAYREGEVLERLDNGGTIVLTARIPEALLGRWNARDGIEVVRQDAA